MLPIPQRCHIQTRRPRKWSLPRTHIYTGVLLSFSLYTHLIHHYKALRSIYTGPSSAFTGHRTAARASNSELNGMKEVSPEMIAYISVQVSSLSLLLNTLTSIITSRLIMRSPTSGIGVTLPRAHSITKSSSRTSSSCFAIETLPGSKRPSSI